MSQMEPGEIEEESALGEQTQDRVQDEGGNTQVGAPFFAFLSFFIALILLLTFLNTSLDGLTRLLVLFGLIVFGILGALLLDRRSSLTALLSSMSRRRDMLSGDNLVSVPMVAEEMQEEEDGDDVLTSFELLVREALNALPDEFWEQMGNLVVFVESEPDAETLERFSAEEGQILLGLYQGTPLTAQSYQGALLPERITLYQRPIELYCHGDPVRIREQIQRTLLHEVAHHFGIDHEEMPIWIK